ncbi:MAG TPA: TIGR01777 family oxidoreductase [Vicinamibacterales bacterium]|nr:TIGR01777 family oxidoreductase [Vicinamibacterales bacterium]
MRVLILGATGFIGRALVPRLRRDKHAIAAWVRSDARARSLLGAEVELVPASRGPAALVTALSSADAVVNLAGEPIIGRRWTAARRRVLEESRIGVTRELVQAIAAASPRPRVLVSGSAVGWYGDRGDERLTERSTAGDDFLARLCRAWENAAIAAEASGVRVVLLRTGVVLGRNGGALAQMLPPFRFGLGGPIGSGDQYFPWIHLHDHVSAIASMIADDRYRGPVNAVAPQEATSRTFAAALGRALHRPAILPTPALALRALFGEAATVMLASQRVEPAALKSHGFTFTFPDLDGALVDIVGGAPVAIGPAASGRPGDGVAAGSAGGADASPPRYELRTTTIVDAPLRDTFAFFSRAENLGLITPASMQFVLTSPAPAIQQGATIEYRMRVGLATLRWKSRIAVWEPGRRFVDVQEAGPYRMWWHEHAFRADGPRTVMEDRVIYAPPLGALGRFANRLFVAPALTRIFQYRGDVIRLRFGTAGAE